MKLIAAVACAAVASADVFSEETKSAFALFKAKYAKVYRDDMHERSALAAFASNIIKADERNSHGGAVHGITKFMDLTPEEFKSQYLNYVSSRTGEARLLQDSKALPKAVDAIDWSDDKTSPFRVLSAVKDQGRCGSCWAFSTTEQIESVWAMKNGVDARRFSTQQVVACDPGSLGCQGGDTVSGFKYIKNFGGIELAQDYADTSSSGGRTGRCEADITKVVNGTQVDETVFCIDECVSGSCTKTAADTEKAKQCITAAPQSICVNAESWQTYVRGVLTDRECGSHGASALDHCVQVVGYDSGAAKPYYVVRNSWAANWGYEGMIHLSMEGNTCGILDEMTTVTLRD